MANNYLQPGDTLAYTNAGAAIASGAVIVMGKRIAVALTDIHGGGGGSIAVRGVFKLPKLATDDVAQGALLYWDAGASRLTTTVASNVLAGYASAPAGAGTSSVAISLNA